MTEPQPTERVSVEKMVEKGLAEPIPDTDPQQFRLTAAGLLLETHAVFAMAASEIHEAVAGLHQYVDAMVSTVDKLAENTPFDANGKRIQSEEPHARPTDDAGYL